SAPLNGVMLHHQRFARSFMFERFTERARRVVFFARYEAGLEGGPAITGDHLLLGLLQENDGELAQLLPRVEREALPGQERPEGQERKPREEPADQNGFGAEGRRMLTFAREEAERLGHRDISTGHLLLGILRDESSRAAVMLTERGVRLDAVRAAL